MRGTVIRWSVTLLLLALVTSNLLAQPVPPRPPGDAYPAPPTDPYPWPPQPYPGPTTEPYPWPTRNPYPWPTMAPSEPYPVIPTRTPRATEPTLSERDAPRLILGSVKRQAESVAAPTRDYEWEGEFYTIHGRSPDSHDVADRLWSLGFLARTGRVPTESEWVANYYGR